MRAAVLAMAVLTAGEAVALTPLPECHDAAVGDYNIGWHGGGFVAYAPWAGEDYRVILDDCGGGQRLMMTIAYDDNAKLDVVWRALEAKQSYTMSRIAGIAREAGAKITQGRASYESCACQKYGG